MKIKTYVLALHRAHILNELARVDLHRKSLQIGENLLSHVSLLVESAEWIYASVFETTTVT